jgi:hypothetical protein
MTPAPIASPQRNQNLDIIGLPRFDAARCSYYVPVMAAAHASARGQRAAILASPLHELTGFCLATDCLAFCCGGERTHAVAELASFYGRDRTVGDVLRRMRCSGGCGGCVGAAWLVTGPVLNMRGRPQRMALLGVKVRE